MTITQSPKTMPTAITAQHAPVLTPALPILRLPILIVKARLLGQGR